MKATFYSGRDNYYTLACTLDDTPFDLSAATDIEVKFPDGGVKLSEKPEVFEVAGTDMRLSLGEAELPTGIHLAHIIVYTTAWPNGMVFGQAEITVEEV